MLWLLFKLVAICCFTSSICPLIVFVIWRRRYGGFVMGRWKTVVAYYVGVALSFLAFVSAANLEVFRNTGYNFGAAHVLVILFEVLLLTLSLAGPFVAYHIVSVARAKALRIPLCGYCGYNLTGNVSGTCPECGAPGGRSAQAVPDRRHSGGIPWRSVLPAWALLVILFLGLQGYRRVTEAWLCSECCRHEYRSVHRFGLSFGGPVLLEVRGQVHKERRDLTLYLDPDDDCTHNWIGFGYNGEGLTWGVRGIGFDRSSNIAESEPDFARFVDEHPDVLERIRETLRERGHLSEWLDDEFFAWQESQREPAADD